MKKVLFVVAHPHLSESRANRFIVEQLKNLPNVTYHNLYDLYPYFHIDYRKEQELLLQHDMIFLQHPFYWYSMPPLLKMWIDEVFKFGFAYGPQGEALKGKDFQISITTGGGAEAYAPSGYNKRNIDEYLTPYVQTADLCQMPWRKPFIFFLASRASDRHLLEHADEIKTFIEKYVFP